MPIQTRYAGDAKGINNVDAAYDGTLATIISTGLTKNPTAFTVKLGKSQTFEAADAATGNAIETILRQVAIDSTIVMYQVDTSQLSILVEAVGSNATTIGSRITALGNVSASSGNVWANAATVSNGSLGFKLA
ncbi:hypothetical protein UFOVP112_261 [uncultured Caudovirales phage]|uniref:Uncharacterized protein n=1 Tax=uncultured Caudovirales phage TaxID=2100421 RepID=A0A6J5L730_9CAUD|nr:hypothetical protein UFOVP112_261 [uncultured Caudovirales phage]